VTGTIVLQGGAPFAAHDELDRRVLAAAAATSVVVLPTADAFEDPARLVEAAGAWADRLGITIEPLAVMKRVDAQDTAMAARVSDARAVYLVGDSSLHLRATLKDTPVWSAVEAVVTAGGVVVGVGQSASALCDPMNDPRGGAFTLGLGLVQGVALMAEADTVTPDRLARTIKLADVPLMQLASDAAAVIGADGGWELIGTAVAHGSWRVDPDGRVRPG
jgi:cyanophycinase